MAKATKKKPARKRKTKAADGEITAKRAKAYAGLEPHLCAVVNMGTIVCNLRSHRQRALRLRGALPRGDAGRSQGALLCLGLPAMKRARSSITSELTPQHVVADLFDSDDFPVPISDPEAAAEIVIQRLIDAGFEIKAQERVQS
jgi:hypothetical protein